MFKAIGLSIGAFLSDPLKFVADPANTVAEYRAKQLVEEGKTPAEIEAEMKAAGLLKGAGPVKRILDALNSGAEIVLKYLPQILLILVVLFVAWWSLKFVRVLK